MLQRQDLEVNNKQLLNEMQRLRNALEQVNWSKRMLQRQDLEVNNKQLLNEMQRLRNALEQVKGVLQGLRREVFFCFFTQCVLELLGQEREFIYLKI